jgi:predicted nucleic acid-binding protein
MLRRLTIASVEVDHAEVVLLAERNGLTAYDASYLWLARRLEVELVTLDQSLEETWSAGRT